VQRVPRDRNQTTLLQPGPADGGRPPVRRGRPAAGPRRIVAVCGVLGVVLLAGIVAAALVVVNGRGHHQAARSAAASAGMPMLGTSISSAASLAQDTAQFGRMPVVRVYYPGLPAASAWTTGLAAANHSAVVVSFKAEPGTILSGADDAALTHFFDTAPTDHPVYYSYYHEPEDNIAAGEFTLADYKAAWARVVQLADAAHNPQLHSTLILMSYDLTAASGRNWKSYLPGGGIISTLGWDAYPVGSATNTRPQLTSPADFMGPCIAASNSVGLPYGFAEFGLSTASGRPGWMTEVGNYLESSGALFATLFNGSPQYPTLQLSDSASQSVWKTFVTQSMQALTQASPSASAPPAPATSAPAATPSAPPASPTAPATASPSAAASSPAPAAGGWVTGLTLNPARFAATGSNHTVISFRIAHPATVTIQVLNADGTVVRQISKPARAGQVSQLYYGYNGSSLRLPAGTYTVRVIATDSGGHASADTKLTLTAH
jgi:hypothetical protein